MNLMDLIINEQSSKQLNEQLNKQLNEQLNEQLKNADNKNQKIINIKPTRNKSRISILETNSFKRIGNINNIKL